MPDDQLNEAPPPQRGNSRTIFYILLLVLLLGINVYLYIKYNQRNTENQQLAELVTTDSVKLTDLDLKYQEALVNIESYKGQNAQLDSLIEVKEKALLDLKNSYASLNKNNKIAKAEYEKQVASLNDITVDLQKQIDQLRAQNNLLITKNDALGDSLASQITTSTQLQTTNAALAKKVNIASLLRPTAITATGIRSKSSGKEDETNSARKAEKLKVCWEIPQNDVADPGEKVFYVRIISPEGITVAVQSSGSGVINDADTGNPIQFTTTTTVNYEQKPTSACTYWEQSSPYNKGTYTAEIYQDGYLIGTQKFEMK